MHLLLLCVLMSESVLWLTFCWSGKWRANEAHVPLLICCTSVPIVHARFYFTHALTHLSSSVPVPPPPCSQKHCPNFVSVPEPIQGYMHEVKDQLQQVCVV